MTPVLSSTSSLNGSAPEKSFACPRIDWHDSKTAYITSSLALTVLGIGLLPLSTPAAIVFLTAATWCRLSAFILYLNQKADEKSSFAKPIHYIHAAITDINSAIAAAVLTPLSLFKCYHRPKGSLQGRPILLINGYLGCGSNWHYLREKLARMGQGPIYLLNVGNGKSIKNYSEQLRQKVIEIQNETGKNEIAFICHSKGGLVGADYATRLAKHDQVRITDLITIGSPLNGTPAAKIAPGRDGAEMRRNSSFLKGFQEALGKHTGTRFFHIASTTDPIVSHLSATASNHPNKRICILSDHGHLSPLFSTRVADQINFWLCEHLPGDAP